MQASLRHLAREVLGYGFGLAITRALGVVVALIYPTILSQAEYGALGVVLSLTAMLVLLFWLGLDVALTRLYYESDDVVQRRQLVAPVVYAVVGVTVVVIAVLLAFSQPLALWLYARPEYVPYLQLALLSMPFSQIHGIHLLILRLTRRIRLFNMLAVANLVASAAVSLYAVLVWGWGTAGVLLGVVVGYAVTAAVGTVLNWRDLWYPPRWDRLPEMLRLGMPLLLAGLAQWLLAFVDRTLLVHYVSAAAIGHYEMANGVVSVLALSFSAFQNAWGPFSFALIGREGSQPLYARTLTLFAGVGGITVLASALFAPELLLLIGVLTAKTWQAAAPSVGPLALGVLFYGIWLIVQIGAHVARNTLAIAATTALAALVNVGLNLLLIPSLGIYGSALATAAGYGTAAILLYVLAQRLAHVPYERGKVLLTLAVTAGLVLLAPQIAAATDWALSAFVWKGLVLALYSVLLVAVGVIAWTDVRRLWRAIRRRARFGPPGSQA